MRRRWSIRLLRRRREPRPPRTPAEQERRHRRQLVVAVCALALALWAILSVRPPTKPGLEVGSPSPSDVRASRSVTFNSERLTEAQRVLAESAADTLVYTRDSQIPIAQRAQLTDLLQTITQIRTDPSLTPTDRRARLTTLPTSTLTISPELAVAILRLSDEEWNNVRLQSLALYDRAFTEHNYVLNADAVTELRMSLLPYWSSQLAEGQQQRLMLLFASSFIKPNSVLDAEATRARKQASRDAVAPVMVRIQQGESIVRQGEIVTPETLEKLQALGEVNAKSDWRDVAGKAVLAALAAAIFGIYLARFQPQVWMFSRSL